MNSQLKYSKEWRNLIKEKMHISWNAMHFGLRRIITWITICLNMAVNVSAEFSPVDRKQVLQSNKATYICTINIMQPGS